jgi:poly(3-hydroxybutyrate) depolymerase
MPRAPAVKQSSLSGLLQAAALACLLQSAAAERLPGVAADLSGTSVSGVSSGGYMAVQFHIAHSHMVIGAGVLAAGPYYCAQGSAWMAIYNCMKPSSWTPLPPVGLLETDTDILARSGQIDATMNLKRAHVWLFTGKRDDTVSPTVVAALKRYYEEYVPSAAIAFVDGINAGHAMITAGHGASCSSSAPPYINDCHFDAAGQLLQHIYGPLDPPPERETGRLVAFDQTEFAAEVYAIGLADTGYVYLPHSCESTSCRVHVAFHGCRQNFDAVGIAFMREAGYNRWADSNRIIVLYPQTVSRYGLGGWPVSFVLNPNGCWDWWGYTGSVYHTRSGAQIRAIEAMLVRLAEHR